MVARRSNSNLSMLHLEKVDCCIVSFVMMLSVVGVVMMMMMFG